MPINWNGATASSNCNGGATATKVSGPNSGDQFEAGNHTITYQASDNCGNQEVCSFTINVSSTPTDLSITCPADRVFQIPAGQTQIQATWDVPTASSSCPNGATVSQIGGPNNSSFLSVGNYTITYQAIDNCGNTEICSFGVTINETSTALTVNCPSNQAIIIPADQSSILLTWTDPTASTNCPNGTTINQIGGTPKFNVVGAGTYTITYEATDNCGNRETCSFDIIITQSQSSLTINCPSNQTLVLPSGESAMAITWIIPTSNSDCPSGATVNQIGGPSPSSNQGAGTYTISYEATDNCGNAETCSFTIIIEDNTLVEGSDITISCPNDIMLEIPYNESSSTIDWVVPNVTTTCVISGGGTTCTGTAIVGYSYLGEFEGSQYYKSDQPLNFPLALVAVAEAGGNLVKINSAEENEFLRQNIGTDLCIIGLTDNQTEGEWLWTDGTAPSFLNFPNNLNNNPSEDFAVMNFWNGEWELTTDFIYKKYILEIPCGGGNDNVPSQIQLDQIEGPTSGSNFGVGTTSITYEAMDECGNITACSFNVVITQVDAPNTDAGPPTAVVSVTNTTVSDDFEVTIIFNEPVTSLSGYDLAISNANWYNFTATNGTLFTVMLDPINLGDVMVAVPANVAFDSDIQGNEASNNIVVNYDPNGNSNDGGESNNLPPS